MKTLINEVSETVKILENDLPNLTEKEIIHLAIELHKLQAAQEANELFKKAFVMYNTDEYPGALEAIAIQLGFTLHKAEFLSKDFKVKDFDKF